MNQTPPASAPERRENRRATWAVAPALTGAVVGLLLYLLSRSNFLLFHSVVELFGIVVCFGIFVVAWNTRRWVSNHFLLFLGIAYLFVAAVGIFHTLSFRGMGVFPAYSTNEAAQFWMLARFVEASSLLLAPLFLTRRLRSTLAFGTFFLVTGFGLLSICRLGLFPDCFIEGQGLTTFKIASEYVISAVLVAALVFLYRRREAFEPRVFRLLATGILLSAAAEMAFTLYADVFGIASAAGHILKAASFFFVYRAVVETSLMTPQEFLFRSIAQERDRAQSYLDVAGVILIVVGRDGRVQLINRKGVEVLGRREDEIVGRNWFQEFLPDSRRPRALELFAALMEGRTEVAERSEGPVLTRSGGERTIAWHNSVLREAGGAIVGMLSSGEDVTEQRDAERALAASRQRLQLLFDRAPDGYYLSDMDGRFVDANRAAETLVGYRKDELLGRSFVEAGLLKPQDVPAAGTLLGRSVQGLPTGPDELTLVRKDGSTVVVEIRTEPVDVEGRRLILGIARDVTERRLSEERERASRTRLESLVGILQHEAKTVQELLEYALEEAVRLTASRLGYIYLFDEKKGEFTLNTWSRDVMKECAIQSPQSVCGLERTGLWGEAVRQRRPIVVNNFDAPNPLKRGYPPGHAKLHKYATIPVFSGDLIVAVVGVANRLTDYTDLEVLQLTLLMEAVWRVVERTRAEQLQKRFAERLESAMSAGNLAWWQMSLPSGEVVFDERKARMLGYQPSEFPRSRRDFWGLLHSDDVKAAMTAMDDYLEGRTESYEVQYRIRGSGGQFRWFRDVCSVTARDVDGRPSVVTGILVDISRLMETEERLRASNVELQELAARIEAAREEERAAVAWELHDEIGQALSAMKMELYGCSRKLPPEVREVTRPGLTRMDGLLDGVITRLRRLYTDLVPVMLQDLGLAPTIEWKAGQLRRETGMDICVGRVENVRLPDDRTALGLFRVLQDALECMLRDRRATRVEVDFLCEDGHAVLRVADNGRPLNIDAIGGAEGRALAAIRERARSWGGEVRVTASAPEGAMLEVTVPLESH